MNKDKITYTYLFKSYNNLYKIGKTQNLANRTNTLLNGNPDLEYITHIEGDFERELKKLLKPFHYKREFYCLDEENYLSLIEYFFERNILKQ